MMFGATVFEIPVTMGLWFRTKTLPMSSIQKRDDDNNYASTRNYWPRMSCGWVPTARGGAGRMGGGWTS
eukprot:1968384-Amphidinium_carterae.1